ncbi:MAG: VanZ family protein [Phycisphaerae bacterium]|nr:VanZ family protein [Phycisphaerae bacterium]
MAQLRHNMVTEAVGDRFLVFLRRRWLETLTVLYIITIAYNSLVPLDFSRQVAELEDESGWFLGLPAVHFSITDAASNVMFYVPLGILLCAVLVKWRWGRLLGMAATVLFAVGLSYLMERLQFWSQTRVCSAFDLLHNLIGAGVGAIISGGVMLLARRIAARFIQELQGRPSLVITGTLGFALVVVALLPMDVTFSVDRLHQAVKDAHLVPFEKIQLLDQAWQVDVDNPLLRYQRLRDWWMLALDYVTWSVLYAVLALAVCYYLRCHCRMGFWAAVPHAVGMCACYSVGSSVLQFFIISRGLDVTVPLFQMCGAALGTLLQPLVLPRVERAGSTLWALDWGRSWRLLRAGLAVVVVGIVLHQTVPFRFDTSASGIMDQIDKADWLPMATYQNSRFHVAVDDVAHKVLRFGVFGALLAAAFALKDAGAGLPCPWRSGALVALVVAGSEVVQVLLPSRIPGVTDVLLAWFGTTAGVYLWHLGRLWHFETRSALRDGAWHRIDYRVELGDPDDQHAPRERVPGTRRMEN